jgi:CRP/FNR family cyclic AMP-dependent transcriptional regulator
MLNNAMADLGHKLLEKCPLLGVIHEQGRRELLSHARLRSFAPSEPIFHMGEPGLSMMGVVVGTVRISRPTTKGREIILADLPPGELFGEIAMLDGKPRSANATALTNCNLLVLERRDVIPILERNPAACLKLMEMLCARIRRSDERMSDVAFFDLPIRIAKILLHILGQRPGLTKLSLTQSELADMCGGTRENVNRCLRGWQRRGIVELRDRFTIIHKPEFLRGLVEII